ncbi:MAG: uroporphyrinogen-III C-methyltransferase [Candidatus Omnitrophica bacterium]|nr:uroporphyrinogen-III C-methyltransferase [Candidatus Omnitrophota bacterium]MBU4468209.1 uroporphyrinogen-III C-methyltransferase [Candidatus Omnitrophota bacterium]MCG2708292.1 uroporphyrinogen-III C-methyltransferase [Candidatus Omnitrophota bacterium]
MNRKLNKGKVYLVGAGPGDPGLITLKASECLKQAEVVLYDRLIPKGILRHCSSAALLKYVGKEKGKAFAQEKINRLLLDYALQGKQVVRLKGGDAFIFGRGQEETAFLKSNGIACEVIPGVSSCYAVPEACGIPLTDRSQASGFMVLTGHEDGRKKNHGQYLWHAAKFPGTIVIMMGLSNLQEITEKLIAFGKDGTTPAAVITNGTTRKKQIAIGRLADIAAKAQGFKAPAICVIGDVVNIGFALNPSLKPLDKKRYLTTASDTLNYDIARNLENLGARVERLPLIRIEPNNDMALLDKIITEVRTFDRLVFTSRHGVHYFLKRYSALKGKITDLAGKIACVGSGTSAEFSKHHIEVSLMPKEFTTKELASALVAEGIAAKNIALLRTRLKRDYLKKTLLDAGARITDCVVYNVEDSQDEKSIAKAIAKKPDGIIFLSPRSARRFFTLVPARSKERLLENSSFLSIGPVTTAVLKAQGVNTVRAAKAHTVQGIIDLCLA